MAKVKDSSKKLKVFIYNFMTHVAIILAIFVTSAIAYLLFLVRLKESLLNFELSR
jgi:hypothetical protein